MKQIPYNLYIHLEQLSKILQGGATRQENILKCGVAAIELSTNLLGSLIQQTERPGQANLVNHLLEGIETQLRLLNLHFGNLGVTSYQPCYSEHIENLKLLNAGYRPQIDSITRNYFQFSESVTLGLEAQFNEIRSHFDLSQIETKPAAKTDRKVLSDKISFLQLDELEYFNSEDKLFMVTHQISECWFKIVINEITTVYEFFQENKVDLYQVEPHFKAACDVLIYLADHILILEHMVLADYHPLRVALRGASGGQSEQSHAMFALAQKTYATFLGILKKQERTVIQVLEKPKKYPDSLVIIDHFARLERSLKTFFFQHYVLSSSVIGSQSFGSIGHDLVTLVDKFVQPIFKDIDQAKYDLTLKTNFQYGATAGELIYTKEEPVSKPVQRQLAASALIDEAISSYFESISQLDMERWINLFTEDGYIEDPVGSRPYIGHKQLAIFFKGVMRFFSALDMTIRQRSQIESHTKVSWSAKATTYRGKAITFEGEEVFNIDQNGKIQSAEVYWDPAVIAEQL